MPKSFAKKITFSFVNIDRATVKGIEFNGRLNLDQLWSALPQGAEARLSFTQARGRLTGGDGMRALQPFKLVTGFGFDAPSQNWGFIMISVILRPRKNVIPSKPLMIGAVKLSTMQNT